MIDERKQVVMALVEKTSRFVTALEVIGQGAAEGMVAIDELLPALIKLARAFPDTTSTALSAIEAAVHGKIELQKMINHIEGSKKAFREILAINDRL